MKKYLLIDLCLAGAVSVIFSVVSMVQLAKGSPNYEATLSVSWAATITVAVLGILYWRRR